MKQFIATLIVLSVIGIAGYSYMLHFQRKSAARAYDSALAEVQREFTEKLGPVRAIDQTGQYEREIGALLRWYFAEIQRLRNQFPGYGDPDHVMKEIEREKEAGKMDQADFEQYKQHFEYVRTLFENLEKGKYGIFLTDFGANLRFDMLEITREQFENESKIRADFILWGAPRIFEDRQDRPGVTVRSVNVPVRFTKLFFQFINEDGHIHGEMSASSGEPYLKIVHPERWIPEFPPMAVLGRYWIDLFPDEAKNFVMEIAVQSITTAGTRVAADYRWELEVPSFWRMGGDWGGVETYRDEAYIQRSNEP